MKYRNSTRGARVPGGEVGSDGPARAAASTRRWRSAAGLLFAMALAAGCRQDMHDAPRYRPLRESAFFTNGSSARPLVEGTIARGTLQEDTAFFTGRTTSGVVAELPFPLTMDVVNRGEERFNIFCAPCHGRTGEGDGMVVQRGYRPPPSLHIDRLREVEIGHFFDVMTNGFGAMPDYRTQIAPRDRWTIAAYIRALQLSQHAAAADVPGGDPASVPREPEPGPPPRGH